MRTDQHKRNQKLSVIYANVLKPVERHTIDNFAVSNIRASGKIGEGNFDVTQLLFTTGQPLNSVWRSWRSFPQQKSERPINPEMFSMTNEKNL